MRHMPVASGKVVQEAGHLARPGDRATPLDAADAGRLRFLSGNGFLAVAAA